MATTTPRLNLPRPEPEDLVTRANHNALVDAIDANAETPAGAQAKADEAEQRAKQYTDGKVADIDVPVTSVNGKTGAVNIDKSDVGLSNLINVKQATKTEFDDHVDDHRAHGATYENEPSAIVRRDSQGRASVSNPTQNEHIANKGYTDESANEAKDAAIDWAKSFGLGTYDIRLSNDLNDETEIGWTRIDDEDTANRPAGFGWGFCFTGVRSGGARYQIAYRTDGSGIDIRSRKYVSGAWDSDWAIDWNSDSLHDPARLNQVNTFKKPQIIELDNTGHAVAQRLRSTGVGSDYGWSLRADGTIGLHDYVTGETLVTFGPNGMNARQGLAVDGRVTILDLLSLSVSGRTAYIQGGENPNDTNAELRVTRRNTPTGRLARFGVYAEQAQINNQDIWTSGNQGNPNNLNTASKQVVGAINEVRNEAWANRNAPSSNQSDSGYQKFPTGLMMAYVKRETSNISEGSSQIVFPTAFVRTPSITATIETQDTNPANNIFVSVSQASNTGCYVHFNVPSSVSLDGFTINVQAIGY